MRFMQRHVVRVLFILSVLGGWNIAVGVPPPGKSVPARAAPASVKKVSAKKAAAVAPQGPANASASEQNRPSNLIFDDAQSLKFLIDPPGGNGNAQAAKANAQAVASILKTYGIDVGAAATTPFLSQVSYFKTKTLTQVVPGSTATLVRPQGSTMTGLFSASSVANAFGTLIATRFKQEAELMAVRRLALQMLVVDGNQPAHPLSVALPKTMAYLKTLTVPATKAAPTKIRIRPVEMNDWAVIQSSIKADMAALPDNGPDFLDALYGNPPVTTSRYLTWLASNTAGQVLKNGRNPNQVFDSVVDTSTSFTTKYPRYPASVGDIDVGLRAFTVLSHMLLASNTDARWHSSKELQQLLGSCTAPSNCDGLYLLLGLSYVRDRALYENIDSWLKANDWPTLGLATPTAAPPAFAKLKALFWDAGQLADALQKVTGDVQNLPKPITDLAQVGPLIADFGSVSAAAIDSMQAFVGKPAIAPGNTTSACDQFCEAKEQFTDTTAQLSMFVDLVGDLQTKQYVTAVGEIVVFIDQQRTAGALPGGAGDFGDFLRANGPFFAAVASAKTSNDLQTALEDYALPAGSYTQQQAKGFSVTLNGYFGGAVSAETLIGNLSGTGASRTRPRFGFAAPVGLAFNFGQVSDSSASNGGFFETGAWSVFVPVIDVGAVASWRLGTGGGNVPAITWQNIVAPGLYAVWSKRDSPLSVLVGAQYGPELRKISTSGSSTIDKPAVQFPCIEFTFNIPIFNLYQ